MRRALATLLLTIAGASPGAAQVRAGGEFQVNSYTTGNQLLSQVSMDAGGRFVIVWQSSGQDGSASGVFGRRYAPDGAANGGEFQVPVATIGTQDFADVTFGPRGSFLVTWSGGAFRDIFARRFEASGVPAGAEFQVNTFTPYRQYRPVAASLANGFVVAWDSNTDYPAHGGMIAARIYDRDGLPSGAQFTVVASATDDHFFPAIASSPGGFVVVWADLMLDAVRGQRFDAAGNALGAQFQPSLSPAPGSLFPSVAMAPDGSLLVVWQKPDGDGSGYAILGRLFAASGAPVGDEFVVNVATTDYQLGPFAASDGLGNFVVTWYSQQGSGYDVLGRRFDASGVPRGAEFLVNSYVTSNQVVGVPAADDVGNFVVTWYSQGQDGSLYGIHAQRFGGLRPAAVAVDTASSPQSDGNRVLEPGEAVDLRPSWRNINGAAQTFGAALFSLTGPAGATYAVTDGSASYGTLANGTEGACTDCFGVSVSAPPSRPALHWDATAVESITPDAHGQRKGWKLHVGDSFTDVARASPYYRFVETLLHGGVTGGCSGSTYCAQGQALREQMPVFVLVAKEGAAYAPPACTAPMFADVPAGSPYCRWIEELARRGVVSGCGGGNYCASAPVSREQMAVFVLRTLDPTLEPPTCTTPMFLDVPADSPFCRWIEELSRRGVVSGCAAGRYCPLDPVTREQMAVFITEGFFLRLYGP